MPFLTVCISPRPQQGAPRLVYNLFKCDKSWLAWHFQQPCQGQRASLTVVFCERVDPKVTYSGKGFHELHQAHAEIAQVDLDTNNNISVSFITYKGKKKVRRCIVQHVNRVLWNTPSQTKNIKKLLHLYAEKAQVS